MPDKDEHERLEDMVEPPHLRVKPAESLEQAANSNNSLEGYAAVNDLNEDPFGKEAVDLEEERAKAAQQSKS